MLGLGKMELIAIIGLFFLFFGGKRIPQLVRALIDSRKAFKEGISKSKDT